MTLIKKIKDKKVNFEFNKEYIKVVTDKISNSDATFITNSFKEMHLPMQLILLNTQAKMTEKI